MKKAFTLIELLVVIAIIAILAAILFPVFAQARDKARQTACLNNLRQLGSAFVMYYQDYHGALPCGWTPYATPGTQWWGDKLVMQVYVKNDKVFTCPSWSIRDGGGFGGYGYNWNLAVYPNWINFGSAKVPRIMDWDFPARTCLLTDNYNMDRSTPHPWSVDPRTEPQPRHAGGKNAKTTAEKGGGPNMCFLDGHTVWMPITHPGMKSKCDPGADRCIWPEPCHLGTWWSPTESSP